MGLVMLLIRRIQHCNVGQWEVHKAHDLGVGGSIPPVASFLLLKIFATSDFQAHFLGLCDLIIRKLVTQYMFYVRA